MTVKRPHRKKTLPVPGDVFIGSDGLMRIILMDGYDVQQYLLGWGEENETDSIHHGVRFHKHTWRELAYRGVYPESFIQEEHGYYYLGNALTDEWENG